MSVATYEQLILWALGLLIGLVSWMLLKIIDIDKRIAITYEWKVHLEKIIENNALAFKQTIKNLEEDIANNGRIFERTIKSLEEEMKRTRDRLHRIEGSFLLREENFTNFLEKIREKASR